MWLGAQYPLATLLDPPSGPPTLAPVFPAVYGGYYIPAGELFWTSDLTTDPDIFAGKLGTQFVMGLAPTPCTPHTPHTLCTTRRTLSTTPHTLCTTRITLFTTPSTLCTTPSTLCTTPHTLCTTPST